MKILKRNIKLIGLTTLVTLISTSQITSAARLSVLFGGGGSGGNGKVYARAFITSTTYDGNLGGVAGADAKCQTRADAANLGGTWKAILSDSTTNANSRMKYRTKPVYDIAGRLLWNPSQGITHSNDSAILFYPSPFTAPGNTVTGYTLLATYLRTTELGTTISSRYVWTGGDAEGKAITNTHCSNWSSTAGSGGLGHSDFVNHNWHSWSLITCSNTNQSLYCLEDE